MDMALDTAGLMVVGMAVLAFLWNLHRDIGGLHRDMGALRQDMNREINALRREVGDIGVRVSDISDRVSRVEGMLAGAGLKISPGSGSASG